MVGVQRRGAVRVAAALRAGEHSQGQRPCEGWRGISCEGFLVEDCAIRGAPLRLVPQPKGLEMSYARASGGLFELERGERCGHLLVTAVRLVGERRFKL